MKKYFFGYLFVRIAKLLAVLTVLAGVGFALFKLEQASIAAQSASYQPSLALKDSLTRLADSLASSRQLVSAFCEQNGGALAVSKNIDFSGPLRDNDELARLSTGLGQADDERRQLKEAVVTRFEVLVSDIQNKLRAHAAEVTPPVAAAGVAAAPAPRPVLQPASVPADQPETLYTGQISNYEIQQRTAVLDKGKDLLKVLESAAEDAGNRRTLVDSESQLDALSHLFPTKIEAPMTVEQPAQFNRPYAVAAPRRELNAEKVADQLARLQGTVRQTMLTAWTVDADYAQAVDLAAGESARCRVATLNVKGIWLAAFGQLGLALLVAVFAAFLVLVLADFMQTLLDTATNTGITANATQIQP